MKVTWYSSPKLYCIFTAVTIITKQGIQIGIKGKNKNRDKSSIPLYSLDYKPHSQISLFFKRWDQDLPSFER